MATKMIPSTSLKTEQDYKNIQQTLSVGKKPFKTLKYLMQSFEEYRQSRKVGWSRPWNKNNVINFQSFKLNDKDNELLDLARQLIDSEFNNMPDKPRIFIEELLNDEKLPLGFIFTQEFDDNGMLYEGVVLSYGRINTENRKYRDRLDIILESPVIDGVSQGLSRLRIFVDPYLQKKETLWQSNKESSFSAATQQLFEHLSNISWDWAEDKTRLWEHWITKYIDYFGPREWIMKKSYFFVQNAPHIRIQTIDNDSNIKI